MNKETALLFIDVQVGSSTVFTPTRTGSARADQQIDRQSARLEHPGHLRSHDGEKGGPLEVGTPGWQFIWLSSLVTTTLIVRKTRSDSFSRRSYRVSLNEGHQDLVVAGCQTNIASIRHRGERSRGLRCDPGKRCAQTHRQQSSDRGADHRASQCLREALMPARIRFR